MSQFIYQKLAKSLSEQIRGEVWSAGTKLPSIRQLSVEFGVAKVSVQRALHELEASGLVEARPRSGYFVRPQKSVSAPQLKPQGKSPKLVNVPAIFHDIMARGAAFDIYPSASHPQHDAHLTLLHRHIGRAMRHKSQLNANYYHSPEGDLNLREQIATLYQNRGCQLEVDEICITSGCQNGLFLALMSCCEPGDIVVVESPAFYGVLQLLQLMKLQVIELPVSATQGMKADDLRQILKTWAIKACILTPNFATPTGACIPSQEKQQLVSLADEHEFTIIEDDIYGDLGFHFNPEPLKHYDTQGNVILCSSFSKTLSRDLRIGWVSGGQHHQRITHLKLLNQLSTSQSIQTGLASFLAEGHYKRHVSQYRQELKQHRDHLLDLLYQHWKLPFKLTVPEGGLALWVELSKQHNIHDFYYPLLEQNIVITPGLLFSSSNQFNHCMRLSFAHPATGQRLQALKTIGQVLSG